MKTSRLTLAILATSLFALTGCGGETDAPADGESDDVTSTPQLKANLPGITVWIDTALHADHRFGTDVWVLHGRTSKNLDSALAFASDDEYGDAQVISPRVFEVTWDGTTTPGLIEGRQFFLRLDVTGATTQTIAGILFQPKLRAATGTTSIEVGADMVPVLVGDRIDFRGTATLAQGVGKFGAADALGAAVSIGHPSAYHYTFDFPSMSFLDAAHVTPPLVKLTGKRGSTPLETDATIALEAVSFGLTQGNPYDAFPEPPCSPQVQACLDALPASQLDTGACGTAKQVLTCRSQPSFATRFAEDLKIALGPWYAQHGADVAAAGGNTLAQAVAAVDVSKVSEVTDPEGDPEAHDLSLFRVFSHPDVVYPGSDIRWFGSYDRATNGLERVYDFN